MSATPIAELSRSALLAKVENPLTRDEALAEIDRRKKVAIDLQAMAVASAMPIITAQLGDGLTTRQLAECYVSIKNYKESGYYGITTPEPLVALRKALYVVLHAEGISLEASALKEWFAKN